MYCFEIETQNKEGFIPDDVYLKVMISIKYEGLNYYSVIYIKAWYIVMRVRNISEDTQTGDGN